MLALCFAVLWLGRTCLSFVWLKWIRSALPWSEGLINYCHCYFYLYLLNMSDFYVIIKLLEIIIAFYGFFYLKKSILVLFLKMKWNENKKKWHEILVVAPIMKHYVDDCRNCNWRSLFLGNWNVTLFITHCHTGEAVVRWCSLKNVFLKISQYSQENTFAGVSFNNFILQLH